MFFSAKSLNKIEPLQKEPFVFYMIKLAGKSTVNVTRLRSLCIEIFKTLNDIDPAFINEMFELRKTKRATRNQCKLDLEVPIINQVTFRAKSTRYLGPKIWNSLSFHKKLSESLTTFKRIMKNRDVVLCKCRIASTSVLLYIMIHAL